jgi:hypothetical protein
VVLDHSQRSPQNINVMQMHGVFSSVVIL